MIGATMTPRLRRGALALALLGCAHAASAALFDDEEARKRIEATNARLAQVQKQLEDRIAAVASGVASCGVTRQRRRCRCAGSRPMRTRRGLPCAASPCRS
jgi:acyl-coenzyme A synthetase/AMP-(fatty) acid ligase